MTTYRVPVLRDFAWQPPVNDRVTVPTESETKGTRYLVIATGSGIFAGKENQVMTAAQDNPTLIGHWIEDTPAEGWTTWVKDEDTWYVFDGTNWNKESIDVLQSQLLVVESEMASAVSALSAVSLAIQGILASEASQASVQSTIQSRVLVLESEMAAEQLVTASAVSALSALSLAVQGALASEASQASIQSQIASRVLVLESEMSQAESELVTKQSQASYIAAYGCLEFIV